MLLQTGDPVRSGVRLAIDPGSVRIGVARSDPSGALATPLSVVRRGRGDLDALASLAATEGAMEILVGLPRSLSGRDGPAAAAAAHEALRAGGHDSRARRQTVDSAAAAVLLEAALESERRTRRAPGELVTPAPPPAPSAPPAAGRPGRPGRAGTAR